MSLVMNDMVKKLHTLQLQKLELAEKPGQTVVPPALPLHIMENKAPEPSFYQYLYQKVGTDVGWHLPSASGESDLVLRFNQPNHQLQVVYLHGNPCGFVELEKQSQSEVEIHRFGLIPSARGLQIGKFFFNWVLHHTWTEGVEKIVLTHSNWDHPAAKSIFSQSGFRQLEVSTAQRSMPDTFVPPTWA